MTATSGTPSASSSMSQPPNCNYSCLKVDRCPNNKHVVIVSLHRPRKKNAISSQLWREIGNCFRTVHLTGDVRAVVLCGGGGGSGASSSPCFTTGLDLSDPTLQLTDLNNNDNKSQNQTSSSSTLDPARLGLAFLPKVREMQSCFTAIEECPVPVIAAVHGFCIGAGVDLITACDIRLCSDDSIFSVREVVVGLAADVGTLQRLPKVVGNQSRVREICYTGEMFDSKEAERIGLVSRVVGGGGGGRSSGKNVVDEAVKIATRIARNSPMAVYGTKRSLLYSRDHSVTDGLEHIAAHNALALQSHDLPQALKAAVKKKQRQNGANFDNFYPYSRL